MDDHEDERKNERKLYNARASRRKRLASVGVSRTDQLYKERFPGHGSWPEAAHKIVRRAMSSDTASRLAGLPRKTVEVPDHVPELQLPNKYLIFTSWGDRDGGNRLLRLQTQYTCSSDDQGKTERARNSLVQAVRTPRQRTWIATRRHLLRSGARKSMVVSGAR